MLVSCILFAWIGVRMKQARDNRARAAASEKAIKKAAGQLEKLGGHVCVAYIKKRPHTWLEELFDDPGNATDSVGFWEGIAAAITTDLDNAMARRLRRLTNLNGLALVTTSGVVHDLEQLKALKGLQFLCLDNARLTDDEIRHLQSLKSLRAVVLDDAWGTAEDVQRIKSFLPDLEVELVDDSRTASNRVAVPR